MRLTEPMYVTTSVATGSTRQLRKANLMCFGCLISLRKEICRRAIKPSTKSFRRADGLERGCRTDAGNTAGNQNDNPAFDGVRAGADFIEVPAMIGRDCNLVHSSG